MFLMARLKSKARLQEYAVDDRQIAAAVVPVFELKRREARNIITGADSGTQKTRNRTKDRVGLRNVYVLQPVIRFPESLPPRQTVCGLDIKRLAVRSACAACRLMGYIGKLGDYFRRLLLPNDVRRLNPLMRRLPVERVD